MEAPWWATGVFTLAGVGLAQLLTFLLYRSRAKFEDSRRWHEDRRDIYLEVVTSALEIEEAIFTHFEHKEPLPGHLDDVKAKLNAAVVKTEIVGSEEVKEATQKLKIEVGHAMRHVAMDQDNLALDHCETIRETLYYLIELMRSELTNNKALMRGWEQRHMQKVTNEMRDQLKERTLHDEPGPYDDPRMFDNE
jgi:hypothetical protein